MQIACNIVVENLEYIFDCYTLRIKSVGVNSIYLLFLNRDMSKLGPVQDRNGYNGSIDYFLLLLCRRNPDGRHGGQCYGVA